MTLSEPQRVYKPPIVLRSHLPRTYQYVSPMENTVDAQERQLHKIHSFGRVLNLCLRSVLSKYADFKPRTSNWWRSRYKEKLPGQILFENRNFLFPTWTTRCLLTDTSTSRDAYDNHFLWRFFATIAHTFLHQCIETNILEHTESNIVSWFIREMLRMQKMIQSSVEFAFQW